MFRLCCAGLCAFALALPMRAADPLGCFPVKAGTRWHYKGLVRWQDGQGQYPRSALVHWTTEVLACRQEGALVAALVEGLPDDLAWFTPGRRPTRKVVLRDGQGRWYRVEANPEEAAVLDPRALLPRVKAEDLFLVEDLKDRRYFAAAGPVREDGLYRWNVSPAGEKRHPEDEEDWRLVPDRPIRGLPETRPALVYRLGYATNPDHEVRWFAPGLGFVRYVYHHHGTRSDVVMHLERVTRR